MRGKKADPEFISAFIQESVLIGCETPDAIVQRAKTIINDIDSQIKEIEKLKIKRSKLLDVVLSFEKPTKDKSEEAKLLPFFKIEYPIICKSLCEQVKKNALSIHDSTPAPTRFAIKQLLESKILTRVGDNLLRGEKFDDYMKFVIREDE